MSQEITITEKRWGIARARSGKLTGLPMFPTKYATDEYIKKFPPSFKYKAIKVDVTYERNIRSN